MPAPEPGVIYWTAYAEPEGDSRPEDPLGFDFYAERLGNCLLPGITGRTVRLRYFGMVCAGLEAVSATRSLSSRRAAFVEWEKAWAFAMCAGANGELKEQRAGSRQPALRDRYRGFRGANLVIRRWRQVKANAAAEVRHRDYRFLRSAASQGGLGSYLVAMKRGGFVDGATLELMSPGREMAAAFRRPLKRLRASELVDRASLPLGRLGRIGVALDLGSPTAEEQVLLRDHLLGRAGDPLAETIRRLPRDRSEEQALRAVADGQEHPVSAAAQYALAFEPLRRAGVEAFGRLGQQIVAAGSVRVGAIDEQALAAAEAASKAASRVAELDPPEGLEPVHGLAGRLAGAGSAQRSIDELLTWHQRLRAPWIERAGSNELVLGRHGAFSVPDHAGFHGYTVGSALSLLRDVEMPV